MSEATWDDIGEKPPRKRVVCSDGRCGGCDACLEAQGYVDEVDDDE